MESIYVAILEILLLEILVKHLSFFSLIFLGIILLYGNYVYYGKKVLIPSLCIFLFLFRSYFFVYHEEIKLNDFVKIESKIEAGKGKINKINNRNLEKNIYINLEKVPDGYYEIEGEILNRNYNPYLEEYTMDVHKFLNKEENILNRFYRKKIYNLTENYPIKLRNFYLAILLGEKDSLDRDTNEKFQKTGTSHLLVISGLHISLVIGIILYSIKKINIHRKYKYTLSLGLLTLYVIGVGPYPAIIRAYIMGVIYLLGNIFYEKVDVKKSLGISALVSISLFPQWIGNISFIFSYLAVGIILYVYPLVPSLKIKNKVWNYLYNHLTLIIVIQIFMTPLYIIYFNKLPILTFISNFFILPIGILFINLAFISLFLSIFYLGFILMPLTNLLFLILLKMVDFLEIIPYLTLEI
ncbi:ComEC/Rec2 family competence protein [Cetobacterium sp. SF1]|uniref:ComEC/Rec2 family competence protein n=1 Tax=unclassified Cetobacterium TaxID=2630983 RepID=UPI003CF3E9E1